VYPRRPVAAAPDHRAVGADVAAHDAVGQAGQGGLGGGGQGRPVADDERRADAGDRERGGGAAQERTAGQEYCLSHGFLRAWQGNGGDYR